MALLDETRVRPRVREERWPGASDDALVRGAVAGADGAFDEIFARYHAPLVRYCRGILLDEHLAQDAAQNALASALRALRGGPAPRVLGPWLYRIAQREAFDLSRRRRQDAAARQFDGPAGEEALLQVAAPSDERTRERLRELVGDLARLPLRQRSALLLRELSGLGYSDIAVALETTPAAARQSVLEARTALADVDAGRADSCATVRALVDGGDRRRLRGRRAQAHLADCAACTAFAARIDDRRRDLALLFPLPAALAGGGGALAVVTGGTVAAGGAGVAAGGISLGLGGASAAKCAIACTAALVGVGAIGESVVHPPRRPAAPEVRVVAQAPQPQAAFRAPASATATSTPAAAPQPATAGRATRKAGAGSRKTAKAATARRRTARRVPVPSASGASSAAEKSAGTTGATAPAPGTTTTTTTTVPVATPTTAAPTPAPAATPAATTASAPAARTQVASADALKARITETAAALTEQARQTVTQTLSSSRQTLDAVGQTVQKVTSTALSGVQAQLDALKRLLHPGSQTPQ